MRQPRRIRFAAPIVVTLAAAGCAPTPETIHANPPPPPQEQPPLNPRHDPPGPVAGELPAPSGNGHVEREPDGTCREYFHVNCPAGVMCNPPPPRQVRCPPK